MDRHRCVGAGNCITIAPTAFDWLEGDVAKAEVVATDSVEEEVLRAAGLSCPTQAIEIEEVQELLPWQLRGKTGPARRVVKTFMFTDIVRSTNLVEALGDEAWEALLRWHDQALREQFNAHEGQEVVATGDGFFVGFDSPDAAVACAVAIQRRLADQRRQHGFAPRSGSGSMPATRPRSGTTSGARGSTRPRGSPPWPTGARSSPARTPPSEPGSPPPSLARWS